MSKGEHLRILDYVEHVLRALERIFTYIEDIDEVGFLQNDMIQDAVIRNLEVLGEAARNLQRYHSAFVDHYSQIPWEDMYWMRNRLSHGYFSIDYEVVWKNT